MRFLRHITFLLLGLAAGACQAAIDRQQYDSILDLIEQVYAPEFKAQGSRLQITRYWKGDSPSATAWKHEDSEGEIAVIQINGGVARHPEINRGGFALIACHTIGHHLAGPPLTWKFSIEGQADYYGASACLRKILPLMAPTTDTVQAAKAGARCAQTLRGEAEQQLCRQIMAAGLSAARYYAGKAGDAMPALSTPDKSLAQGIISGAPSPQCRLDTYMAAATCTHEVKQGAAEGPWLCQPPDPAARPKCWYNP